MISEFIRAFVMIFIAEMGDKSQILAMTFATKYNVKKVMIGLFVGILLNHIIAVFIGSQLSMFIPLNVVTFLAGLIFIVFGLFSLHIKTDDEIKVKETKFGPIITIALLFFLGELGDKTQLTAITLSSDATYPFIILVGTVSGMLLTSILGIYLGIKFGRKIPVVYMKLASSFIFVLFGVLKVLDNTIAFSSSVITIIVIVVLLSYTTLLIHFIKNERNKNSLYVRTASKLKSTYHLLSIKLEDICLQETHCGSCMGGKCLIGYTKEVVRNAMEGKTVNVHYSSNMTIKDHSKTKVFEALDIVIETLKDDFDNPKFEPLHEVRRNFEKIVFGEMIITTTYQEYKVLYNQKRGS